MAQRSKTIVNSADFEKAFAGIELVFQRKIGQKIGETVVDRIQTLAEKGVSPIEGNGRFPAYKATQAAQATTTRAKQQSKLGNKNAAKSMRQEASKIKRKGYPYSVQKDYPGKKPRPVNLTLSGDFLESLKYWLRQTGDRFTVHIGFRNKLSVLKEKGHREGANGQPSRPIIPQDDETLARSIYVEILNIMKQAVKDYYSRLF